MFFQILVHSTFPTVLLGVLYYHYLKPDFKILIALMYLMYIGNSYGSFTSSKSLNNLHALHIYTVLEFVLIGWYYYYNLPDIISKKSILICIVLFSIFSILNSLFIQPINTYNSYARGIEILLIISFSILFYMKNVFDLKREEELSRLIINTGVLVYYGITFIYSISGNIIYKYAYDGYEKTEYYYFFRKIFVYIPTTIAIIFNLVTTYAMYLHIIKQKKLTSIILQKDD